VVRWKKKVCLALGLKVSQKSSKRFPRHGRHTQAQKRLLPTAAATATAAAAAAAAATATDRLFVVEVQGEAQEGQCDDWHGGTATKLLFVI